MGWRQFVMELESLPPARVEAMFSRHGALAVTLSDGGDDPVFEPAPGETPLWRKTAVTGLFDEHQDLDSLKADLRAEFGLEQLPASRIETLDDRDWERAWLEHYRPMRFGDRLWVSPHDGHVDAAQAIVVRLDPGLAFGTGTHPTTALCLEWLDGFDNAGRSVLDFGCGSGILAIAALKLGAQTATAFDIDTQAITATRRNAVANDVGDRLAASIDAPPASDRYDLVMANILAQPLIDLADAIGDHVAAGGMLLLSGILEHQAAAVIDAYADRFAFGDPLVRDGWALLAGEKR